MSLARLPPPSPLPSPSNRPLPRPLLGPLPLLIPSTYAHYSYNLFDSQRVWHTFLAWLGQENVLLGLDVSQHGPQFSNALTQQADLYISKHGHIMH